MTYLTLGLFLIGTLVTFMSCFKIVRSKDKQQLIKYSSYACAGLLFSASLYVIKVVI